LPSEDPVRRAVSKIAAASRKTHKGTEVHVQPGLLEEARAELVAARLEKAIEEALNPPEPYEPLREVDQVRLANKLLDVL
jgi:hypothetical protein